MGLRHERAKAALTTTGPVSWMELALVTAALSALAVLAFGRHVLDGGFWNDDWANLAMYRFGDSPRYVTSVQEFADLLGSRPLLAALLPLPHAIFGASAAAQITMALLLGIATCLSLYLFLREIPLASVHAGAMSCLALVFPWADSIRLWPTASVNTVALIFAFLGAFVALRGIRRDGVASTLALVGAGALYALSVLTYEVAGIALLFVGALYLRHASRRKALRWWATHAGVVFGALLYTLLTTAKEVGTIGDRLDDLPRYTRQGVTLLTYSFGPEGSPAVRYGGLLVAITIVAAGLWRYRASRNPELGFWLAFAGAAVVVVASAYFVVLGAFLEPLRDGVYNRGNIFAAYGFVAFVYALAMIAIRAASGHRVVTAAAAVAVALVAVGYVVRVRNDVADWDRAAKLQEPVVAAVTRASATSPLGSTFFTFGYPSQLSEGIPIFYLEWDLDGALDIELDRSDNVAYPVYETTTLVCDRAGVNIDFHHSDSTGNGDYGTTYFLDVPTGQVRRIASVDACADALRVFRPGPEFVSPDNAVALYGMPIVRRVGSGP